MTRVHVLSRRARLYLGVGRDVCMCDTLGAGHDVGGAKAGSGVTEVE